MSNKLYNFTFYEQTLTDLQSRDNANLVVQSLYFVIVNFFSTVATSITVIISSRHEYGRRYLNMIFEDLMPKMVVMPIELIVLKEGKPSYVAGRYRYNLFMVDSLQGFRDIDPIRYTAQYNTNDFYYILLQQRDHMLLEEMRGIFEYCWQHELLNCNVQVQLENSAILVYTYFPYKPGHQCGATEPTLINEFRQDGKSMRAPILFPRKLRNMNGCPIRVPARSRPPFVRLTNCSNGKVVFEGFEVQLIYTLAKQMNFSVSLVQPVDGAMPALIAECIAGALEKLQRGLADLVVGCIYELPSRSETFTALHGHYKMARTLVVLKAAQRYTALEILTFPFQVEAWLWVSLLLLSGCLGLALLHRFGVESIAQQFEFITIFLGLPTVRMPDDHYKRLICIDWTLCSFILRCFYTALLYHLFCTKLYRPPPDTIAGLIEQNYTIVMTRDVRIGLSYSALFNSTGMRIDTIDTDEIGSYRYLEQNQSAGRKVALMGARDTLLYFGREFGKAGVYHMIPEVVYHQQLTMYVRKHSFLINHLNELILWIQSAGLIDYWVSFEEDVRYFNSRHLESQKMFGQKELSGVYYVCGVLVMISIVVFIVELWKGWFQLYLRKLMYIFGT